VFTAPAARDFAALVKRPPAGNLLQRIDQAFLSLAEDPRPAGARKLVANEEGWRLRVGDYRILYDIEDTTRVVTVGRILHRSAAYRNP
jgi:mRNA interferase RelE/StbE